MCFVSARTGAGVTGLLDVIAGCCPTRRQSADFSERRGRRARLMHARPDPAAHVCWPMFKVSIDPYVGKLGFVRVHQGTIGPPRNCSWATGAKPFKVGHLYRRQGKNQTEVASAGPGDICVSSARWTSCSSTPCCTTPQRTTISTCAPCPSPCRCTASPCFPKRPWRRAAHVGDHEQTGGRRPCLLIEHAGHQRNHSPAVWASCTCACCWIACARSKFEVDARAHCLPRDHHPRRRGQYRHKTSGGANRLAVHLRVEPLARSAGF